jgi:hypothetical protein
MIFPVNLPQEETMTIKTTPNPIKAGVVLILLILLPLSATSGAKSRDPLPPDILPVVILKGSDHDMGVQYGQQAGHYIVINKEEAWADALQKYKKEQIKKSLQANQYYIKKYAPWAIEQMKGVVEGARAAGHNLSYTDMLLLNCTLPKPQTATFPRGYENEQFPPRQCSVCSAWGTATKGGRLIGVDTLDAGGNAAYGVIIVAFPDRGNPYMCGAMAGELGDHFLMNNQGLFIGNSGGGGSPRDGDSNHGLCWAISLPHLARFANSAEQAKSMVMKWQINVPENFHFVDLKGRAFVVEKTAALQAVRRPGDFGEQDFLYSTNNYLHKKMKVTKKGEFIKKHGGYGAYAAPRNLMLWDMLHNYHGSIDVEFAKMMLRFPGSPPPDPPKGGWDAKICRPSNSWVAVVLPHKGDKGLAHICTGPAGRVIHSSTASDGNPMRTTYRYIDGSHTFFTLHLAKNPEAVASQAKKTAQETIARTYQSLMHLTPKQPGYDWLYKIYARGNKEYYRGNLFFNRARLASGSRAVSLFARAATCYSRCQARMEQAFEALVSPATSPTDLGLKPFGGDWAKWETRLK